jgi:hypothetical protein
VHARVRDFEARGANDPLAKQQQVEVESARAIALRPHAAVPCFDREQMAEQIVRRERGLQEGHSVDEVRLIRLAHRRSPIKRRVFQKMCAR